MKPIYDINRHVDYRLSLWRKLKEYYDLSKLPKAHIDIVKKFADLDLTFTDKLMQDRYSDLGPAPRRPSDMLRCLLLSAAWGISSYTQWADLLKTVPLLAIVSGFEPGDVPGVGTIYDFMNRLWCSDEDNFNPAVHPKRERPPKPKRKGEKAPSIEKKPVEDLIEALQHAPGEALQPVRLLFSIFSSIFLSRSVSEDLINLSSLIIAGDGTPLYTSARERSKCICDCRERGIADCTCDRRYSQPDCDWGYDSHRGNYYFGYDLYLLTDPSSGHDLPVFAFLGPASRHDSHGFVYAWSAAKSMIPGFHANQALLDSAHDALAIYRMLLSEQTQPIIDLNKGHSTPLEQKDYTIGSDGIPVCACGLPMKYAGFDKAQHRLKYRCPQMCTRAGHRVCQCKSPCSDAKYGRQVHVYPQSNPRLFCTPPRGTPQWKTAYNGRTGAERANNRIKNDYELKNGRYRSTKAWYCRLFIIMMCLHHDAWTLPESSLGQTDMWAA